MNYDIDNEYSKLVIKKRIEILLYNSKVRFTIKLFTSYYIYIEKHTVFNRYS